MASTHIIVVNYNAGNWLLRSINAALAHSDGAISVIDNNSSDASMANARMALQSNPRIRWIENPDNIGFAAANNMVLGELQEDYAVLVNPDCEINASTLSPIIACFEQYPKMALASCRIYSEDGSVQATCKRKFPTPGSAIVRLTGLGRLFSNNQNLADFDYGHLDTSTQGVEFVEAVSGAFMVVRRQAMEQVGLLDPAYFMHCEDLDWCKRFALAGWQVGFVNEASVVHAKGISSASRPLRVQWNLHRGMNRFFDKFYRHSYSLPTRLLVKLGIAVSFLWRSVLTVLRR
ncbi:MAG: glycosyltransferase family 2 protein [Arenicella sp.]|nr:glycosyltransferase family 2 protein [Arenicella sp.]